MPHKRGGDNGVEINVNEGALKEFILRSENYRESEDKVLEREREWRKILC